MRGFSTIEMMIAMAVMVMTLSAVVVVSYGTQGALIGGETNAEAMNIAQKALEQQQQLARKDFRLVTSTSSAEDIYTSVTTVTPWAGDQYASKKVSTTVSWKDQRNQDRSVTLSTVLSNFINAVGGDTCAAPTGTWSSPLATSYQFDSTDLLPPAVTGVYKISGVEAYRGKLYVSALSTSVNSSPSFFVFGVPNPPQKPAYLGSVDNNSSSITGLNALHIGNVALISSVPHTFAYGANAYGANFNYCAQSASCSQLQVFDVTNPSSPTLAYSFKFATSSASVPNSPPYINGSGGQAVGKSIFYKDGYVYLGLTKTASGPEFTIVDVHNPLNPIAIGPGYDVGAGVESIYIRGKYAYLATDNNSQEFVVLDISDPLNPAQVPSGSVYNPPGVGDGNFVYTVGDTLYFGKNYNSPSAEFYALNIKNPNTGVTLLGSSPLGASVSSIIVRGDLGFVLSGTWLNILNVANPSAISAYAPPLTLPGDAGAGMDCELNYLYAATNNGSNGIISVVKPSP